MNETMNSKNKQNRTMTTEKNDKTHSDRVKSLTDRTIEKYGPALKKLSK